MKKIILLLLVVLSATSCIKPYQKEIYEEIGPNETAFVIPLEKDTKGSQSKLKSEEYLEANKVAAKRIYIPTQWLKTGRLPNSGHYIPSVRVIKVDRAPVTREWTSANGTGTNGNKKEDIDVESKESIGFGIGITTTASIPEEWASRFLYLNSGRTLAQVMDTDVRAYIQNLLTSEFGNRTLAECQDERSAVFSFMRKSTVEYFEGMGIKILTLGAAGGFDYAEPKIQAAIDDKFASAMKIVSAENEVLAAEKFSRARKSIEAQKLLDANIGVLKAIEDGIRSGTLPMPSTLVTGSNNFSLMDLYAIKKMK